jgi:uncharacterized protein YecE (DUF72 family)
MDISLAGFDNPYWKGIFYPDGLPRSKWFAFYCEHFNAYEMNGSFYKFPTVKSLSNWYSKAPSGFRFTVKAPRLITHFRQFRDCRRELSDFYSACADGMREKLDAVLFQCPPKFQFTDERLELILKSMRPDFRNVVEFRHESWWRAEVFDICAQNQLTVSGVSYPGLPDAPVKTAPFGYYRLHGKTKLFYSGYDEPQLQRLYREIIGSNYGHVTVCFNNTASEQGILNALRLREILHENGVFM